MSKKPWVKPELREVEPPVIEIVKQEWSKRFPRPPFIIKVNGKYFGYLEYVGEDQHGTYYSVWMGRSCGTRLVDPVYGRCVYLDRVRETVMLRLRGYEFRTPDGSFGVYDHEKWK